MVADEGPWPSDNGPGPACGYGHGTVDATDQPAVHGPTNLRRVWSALGSCGHHRKPASHEKSGDKVFVRVQPVGTTIIVSVFEMVLLCCT